MPHFFEKKDRWGNGLALWVVVGMVFLIPISLWSLSTFGPMENEVHNWIPKQNRDYQTFEWYKSHFPSEDAVLFTFEGSSLEDPRIDKLVQKMRGTPLADGRRRGGSKYFDRIRTPQDLLVQMQKNKIPYDDALHRLEGVLIGSGPIRLQLTEVGRARKDKVIELLRTQARESLQLELDVQGEDPLPATVASADGEVEFSDGEATEPPADGAPSEVDATVAEGQLMPDEGEEPIALSQGEPIPPHDLTVSWKGMHWDPAKIEKFKELAAALRTPATGKATSGSDKPLVESCFQIPGSPVALAMYLSDAGRAERTKAFQTLQDDAVEAGIPAEAIHMAGSAVAGAALNREVFRSTWDTSVPAWQIHRRSLVLLSGLVGAVLAFWALRSLKLAGLVLGVSYFTALLSTALVPATGGTMNMVLVVMPTLLFVTTLSVAIHLANYWQHAAARDLKTAVVESVNTAWGPCVWAGLTSAIGQASLMTSSLTPIRDFGLYSAIGTLISLVVTLYGLPALLQITPSKPPRSEELDDSFWHGLAAFVARRHVPVTIVSVVISAICMYGLVNFKTETKVIRYFADTTRTVKDYNFIEDNLAGIVPVDVIVRFDRESQQQLKFLQRRDLIRRIEEKLEALPDVSGALSLADFLPDEATPSPSASKTKWVKYNATSRTIESRVKNGEQAAARTLLSVAGDSTKLNAKDDELWRITAQVAVMSKLNYADLGRQIDEICMSVLRDVSGNSTEKVPTLGDSREYHPGASHVVTGMVPLFLATQRELLDSFIWSFSGAFGSIALMMMLTLRHPVAGFLAMIPNILPIGAVFGIVSWSGLHIDMGSTVTASIALGITIDGTLHLITWFRIGIQQGKSRAEAVAQALGHCGPAMWQTTLVVSLGLVMLYPSDLILISRFGWLMAALLAAASVTDLVLTPALLAGPLGYLIQRCTPMPASSDTEVPEPHVQMVQSEAAEPVGVVSGKPHLEKRGVRIRRID